MTVQQIHTYEICMYAHGHHSATTCTSLHIHGRYLCQCLPSNHFRRAPAACRPTCCTAQQAQHSTVLHSTVVHSTTQHNCAQPEVLVVQWAVCLLPKPVCVCMRACLQRNILHFAVDTALCLLYFQSYTKFRKCLNFFFSWHYNPQWGLYEYFTAL